MYGLKTSFNQRIRYQCIIKLLHYPINIKFYKNNQLGSQKVTSKLKINRYKFIILYLNVRQKQGYI